jgi:RHS repeat-associated protein
MNRNPSIAMNPTIRYAHRATTTLAITLIALSVSAQTSTQNYIRSRRPVVPVTELPALNGLEAKKQGATISYFDGLGRPAQTVAVGQTPAGHDLVQGTYYDSLGRPSRKYLPYEQVGNVGAYRTNWATETANGYPSEVPYSETVFEPSPLNRVKQEWGAGSAWRAADKKVNYKYGFNEANEVRKFFVASNGSVGFTAFYLPRQLKLITTTDEDNRRSREYKDMLGRVVLKMDSLSSTTWAQTYYVYDDMDNLRWVLPPKLVSSTTINTGWTLSPTATLAKQLAYYYRYDGRRRLTEKQLPGAEPVYLVYDHADRLVLSQDGVQRVSSQWAATQYDALGRPIKTAIVTIAGLTTQQAAQDWYNVPANAASLPALMAAGQRLTRTYYDAYPAHLNAILAFGQRTVADTLMEPATTRTVGMVTAQTVWVLNPEAGTRDSLRTKLYYDDEGRLIQQVAETPYGSITRQSYRHAFRGQVLADELQVDSRGATGWSVQDFNLQHQLRYDHTGRPLRELQRINFGPWEEVQASSYTPLSQLQTQTLGNGLQAVDYNYNIRGWLTKINDPTTIGTDLFAMELKYQATSAATYNQWGGNIGEVVWRTVPYGSQDGLRHRYRYSYDGLSRLTHAYYHKLTDAGAATHAIQHNEYLTYDINGNINSLTRYAANGGTSYLTLDNLAYTYEGNRLKTAINGTSVANLSYPKAPVGQSNLFAYDANGNMTTEPNRRLTVAYNALNLPQQVTSIDNASQSIRYTYDATGRKLAVTYNGISPTYQAYVGPVVYTVNGTALTIDYVGTSYGRLVRNGTAFTPEYHLKDHLGNVRVAFQKNASGLAEVKQVNAYYPFGKAIASLSFDNASGNDLKYNGKELQDFALNFRPLDWYDYGFRYYDPTIGRWHSPDPLCELTRRLSPYNFCRNNPIRYIDPDGMYSTEEWKRDNGITDDDLITVYKATEEKKSGDDNGTEDPTKTTEEKKKIAIDPGHGDKNNKNKQIDPGAVNGTDYEKDIVLTISNTINTILAQKGYSVTMTRTTDKDNAGEKLKWRIDAADGTDIYVSIHVNSSESKTASGFSVCYKNGNDASKSLAQSILDQNTLFTSRGLSERSDLYVLNNYSGTAVLVEAGFISNDTDLNIMKTNSTQIGTEIATGIINYLTN